MRIVVKVEDVTLLSMSEQRSKDGTKTYYQAAILTSDGQAGMISIDKLFYDMGVSPMSKGVLKCEFNDQYGSFRGIGFDSVKK